MAERDDGGGSAVLQRKSLQRSKKFWKLLLRQQAGQLLVIVQPIVQDLNPGCPSSIAGLELGNPLQQRKNYIHCAVCGVRLLDKYEQTASNPFCARCEKTRRQLRKVLEQ